MAKKLSRLVVASHNPGKVREIGALLQPLGISVQSALELGLDDVEETESTFEGNARLKAVATVKATGLPALSDDSGLMVAALDGQPGIHTARWAGEPRNFFNAMKKVHEKLEEKQADDRSAKFVCVLALIWPNGEELITRGEVEGHLVWPIRGENGFGFDPMFVPEGRDITFGEMQPAEKYAMNHRQRAFDALVKALSE